jgi:hypothetical protein
LNRVANLLRRAGHAGHLGNNFVCSYADTAEIEDSLKGVLESQAAGFFFTVIIFRHRASLMTDAG